MAGSVDITDLLKSIDLHGDGGVSRLLEGLFHKYDGAEDVDEPTATEGWCDLAPETVQEWDA